MTLSNSHGEEDETDLGPLQEAGEAELVEAGVRHGTAKTTGCETGTSFNWWGDGTSQNDVFTYEYSGTPGPLDELSRKNVPS